MYRIYQNNISSHSSIPIDGLKDRISSHPRSGEASQVNVGKLST